MGVLPDNELALAIYRECQFTVEIGMGGAVFVGISATELEGALRLSQVPASLWDDVKWRVRVMENAARPVLNRAKPKRGKRGNDANSDRRTAKPA